MTKVNIARVVVLILMFLFFILYFLQLSGYSDYRQSRKNMLTDDTIKQYEEDILAGKDVSIRDYLDKERFSYNNNISKMGLDLSYFIENTFNKGMNAFFKMLNDAVNS